MKELNYNNHKWVKRLVDYNNMKFAKKVNKGETKPKTLCSLFAHTLFTTLNMAFYACLCAVFTVFVTTIALSVIAFAVTMVGVIIVPYLPYEGLQYDPEASLLFMFCWFVVGIIALLETRKTLTYSWYETTVWNTSLTELYRGRKKKREKKVDKQPSLIIEYIKALKNKVCPIIVYNEETNE